MQLATSLRRATSSAYPTALSSPLHSTRVLSSVKLVNEAGNCIGVCARSASRQQQAAGGRRRWQHQEIVKYLKVF